MFVKVLFSQFFPFIKDFLVYQIPDNLTIKKGMIVLVPFGKKEKQALVVDVFKNKPQNINNIKKISKKTPFNLSIEIVDSIFFLSKYYQVPPELFLQKYLVKNFDKQINKKVYLQKNIKNYELKNKQKNVLDLFEKSDYLEIKTIIQKTKITKSSLTSLIEKNYLKEFTNFKNNYKNLSSLTREQKEVLSEIIKNKKAIVHGVTGSGKTEVFIHLFKKILEKNPQAQILFLVPEIILTPQIINKIKDIFPFTQSFNSKLNETERRQVWRAVENGETNIIIGSRSAFFLPFKNLKAVVFDECHSSSYYSQTYPQYRMDEVLINLQKTLKFEYLVFASATPLTEQLYLTKKLGFKYLSLKNRVFTINLPSLEIIDLKKEFLRKNFTPISFRLKEKIDYYLKQKKQVLLFLNRRGFSTAFQCKACGEIQKCPHCDVAMTHHKKLGKKELLICHYCFFTMNVPDQCNYCGSKQTKTFGLGTESLSEYLEKIYPNKKILRIDQDNVTKKNSFETYLKKINEEKIDILVGTQILSKGLNFKNLGLVGVINADLGLHLPDFRATERVFHQLIQTAGRAGRYNLGEVVIQTFLPDSFLIKKLKNYDEENFYKNELSLRKQFFYPPFSEILVLTYSDKSLEKSIKTCKNYAEKLKIKFPKAKINISPSLRPKLKNKYYWQIIIKTTDVDKILKTLDQNLFLISRNPLQF